MAGYASDDECPRRRPPPGGYGSLPGDKSSRAVLSKAEVSSYQLRMASSHPSAHRVHFIDAVVGSSLRPSIAQTKPRDPLAKHRQLLSLLPANVINMPPRRDFDILRESHRFLRDADDEDGSWEAALARRYYDRLFKEYVICDLSGYKRGVVGFRWRTEAEVVHGKGQFCCGHRPCDSREGLCSYEVDFKYKEASKRKRALVKARLCESCAYKLHYRRLQKEWKRQQRCSSHERKKQRCSRSEPRGDSLDDVALESSQGAERRTTQQQGVLAEDLEDKEQSDNDRLNQQEEEEDDKEEYHPSAEERKWLEALAWRGPDPALRSREDDMDDYFNDLLP